MSNYRLLFDGERVSEGTIGKIGLDLFTLTQSRKDFSSITVLRKQGRCWKLDRALDGAIRAIQRNEELDRVERYLTELSANFGKSV